MYQFLSMDYDKFNNWNNRLAYEMPFIEKQISTLQSQPSEGLNILDAACGTGKHAVALAKLGHYVSAADLVPEMVGQAWNNVQAAGASIEVRTAGFGQLESAFGRDRFDLILCLGNSLPHILSLSALSTALDDFGAVLHPGGMLLIQNRNFDAIMSKKDRWMEPQSFREGDEEWLFQRFYDFEPGGLIRFNIITLKRQSHGEWTSNVNSTHLYPQLECDLQQGLATSGFGNIRTYGSMAGEEFTPLASGNLVITANKLSIINRSTEE